MTGVVRHIHSAYDPSNDVWLAIVNRETVVGSIAAFYNDGRTATIAYFIGADHWKKGFGGKAIQGIIGYLVERKHIESIVAEPFERNVGSRRILEKNGFRLKEIVENGSVKNSVPINVCQYVWTAPRPPSL